MEVKTRIKTLVYRKSIRTYEYESVDVFSLVLPEDERAIVHGPKIAPSVRMCAIRRLKRSNLRSFFKIQRISLVPLGAYATNLFRNFHYARTYGQSRKLSRHFSERAAANGNSSERSVGKASSEQNAHFFQRFVQCAPLSKVQERLRARESACTAQGKQFYLGFRGLQPFRSSLFYVLNIPTHVAHT